MIFNPAITPDTSQGIALGRLGHLGRRRAYLHRFFDPTTFVQAPVDAIDYVITHELCHVAEPHHGAAFFELLYKVMPDWERRKQRLERAMA